MRTIIAGSRTISSKDLVFSLIEKAISRGFIITELVYGTANGVDTLGYLYAKANNIPIIKFKPDYNRFGKLAPFIRNQDMANYSDSLILITNGSSGSEHMLSKALQKRLKTIVFRLTDGIITEELFNEGTMENL